MEDTLFRTSLEDIIALNATEGPHTNVYEPKYTAREQLAKLMETVTNVYKAKQSVQAMLQMCRCLVFYGTNMIELEEEDEGGEQLRKAHALLLSAIRGELVDHLTRIDPTPLKEVLKTEHHCLRREDGYTGCVEWMRVLNALGLYASLRGEVKEAGNNAKRILRLAEEAYTEWDGWFKEQPDGCLITDIPVEANGKLSLDTVTEERRPGVTRRFEMDGAYTSTLFYLAQAHTSLGESALASRYCHLTMYHQLLCKQELNKKDWATNALQLSGYYSSHFDYGRAYHTLLAAHAIMPADNPSEDTTGLVAWAFGRFYLHRLDYYGSVKQGRAPPPSEMEEDFAQWWVDFPIPGVPPATEMPPITDFDGARDTFKECIKWLNEALQFHPFESSCTTHIDILKDIKKLYAALMVFEPQRSRRIAMLLRQIALLEPLPDQLNFNSYPIVIRQLLYDLGFMYEDLIQMRAEQRRAPAEGEKPLNDKAFNELVTKTVGYYRKFCETWRNPTTHEIPTVLDEDSRLPYFRALMRLAHLQLKFAYRTAKDEYDGIGRACSDFKATIAFAEANPFPADVQAEVAKEVVLAKDMTTVLPAKQLSLWQAYQRTQRS